MTPMLIPRNRLRWIILIVEVVYAPLAVIKQAVWVVHEIGRWREVGLRPKVSGIAGSMSNCRKGREDKWLEMHLVWSLAEAIDSDVNCNAEISSILGGMIGVFMCVPPSKAPINSDTWMEFS